MTILLAWALAWLTLQIEFGEVSPSAWLLDFMFTVREGAREVQAEASVLGCGQPGSHSDSPHPTSHPPTLASQGLPQFPRGKAAAHDQWALARQSIISHSVKVTVSLFNGASSHLRFIFRLGVHYPL